MLSGFSAGEVGTLIVLVLPLSACGVSIKGTNEVPAAPIQQMRTDTSFADEYQVEDLACQSASEAQTIGPQSINLWNGVSTQPVQFTFQDTTSTTSLTSPAVAASYFNFYQRTNCGAVGDAASCDKGTVIDQPSALRICHSSGSYPRVSVEGVALSSLANISVAFNYYQKIPNRRPDLASAALLVLPSLEKTYEGDTKRSVATDNLAYAPDFGGQPAFVVFPKGARTAAEGLWQGLNLWEVPWGLAHEFGHHVFRTHTGISTVGDEKVGLDGVLPIHSFPTREEAANLALTGRTVTDADVWGSINEGYADLYAYYVYGAQPGLTKNVDCFDGNREVSQGTFANGEAKALTADIIATFYSPSALVPGSCKDGPNFQDIHAIGAIVAHGIDQLLSATLGAAQGPDAAFKKVQLLLAFAERLGATEGKAQAANTPLTFDLLIKDALLTAAPDGKLKSAACAAVRGAFPQYADGWFASGGAFTCQ